MPVYAVIGAIITPLTTWTTQKTLAKQLCIWNISSSWCRRSLIIPELLDNLSFHLQVVDKMLPYVNELCLGISDVVGEDWPVFIERNRLHYTISYFVLTTRNVAWSQSNISNSSSEQPMVRINWQRYWNQIFTITKEYKKNMLNCTYPLDRLKVTSLKYIGTKKHILSYPSASGLWLVLD